MKTWLWSIVGLAFFGAALFAQSDPAAEADRMAIVQAALDYADGFYTGDAARMERAIHPDLNKAVMVRLPQTGQLALQYSTWSGLVELTRAKAGLREEALRKLQAEVLAVDGEVACARVLSALFNDHLTLVKGANGWQIVNVLWTAGPDSPQRQPLAGFAAETEKPRVEAAVRDFFTGIMVGGTPAIDAFLLPEARPAQLVPFAATGRTAVFRSGAGLLREATRAKLLLVPPERRQVSVRVLDILDGMAFVVADSAVAVSWLQLVLWDGQWKIVNMLNRTKAPPAGVRK